MCDLYLGVTRATSPPSPFWTNPSIQSSTYTFTRNPATPYPINVQLQNHDTATGCTSALVDLYWSDPTTSFLILSGNKIASTMIPPTAPIAAATTIPPADGSTTFPFAWSPDGTVISGDPSNPGHVCLAAIAQCTSSDCIAPAPTIPGQTAATGSPLVAIHNVQVNDPPPGPSPPPGPRRRIWPFFFGATNGAQVAGHTRLTARAYNPQEEADRGHILHLAGLPAVRATLGRCPKFAAPAEVQIALGVESVLVPRAVVPGGAPPRLGNTGALHPEFGDALVKKDWVKASAGHAAVKEVELLPRQVHQAAVQVVPHGDEGHVYAVEVSHELLTKGAPVLLGGLTILFVTPCHPW